MAKSKIVDVNENIANGVTTGYKKIEPGTYFGITISENMMLPGIIIGILGIVMVNINYPIYKRILNSRRNKYAGKIIALSDEILSG